MCVLQTMEMCTFEVVSHRIDIVNYIFPYVACLLKQDPLCLKSFVLMFWVLFVRAFLVWSCTSISYLGNYLLQVLITIALRDCTTN